MGAITCCHGCSRPRRWRIRRASANPPSARAAASRWLAENHQQLQDAPDAHRRACSGLSTRLANGTVRNVATKKSYPHIGRKTHPLDRTHWESCYHKGETPWDHGEPSPGLADFLAHKRYTPGRVLVPGCGLGHDCRLLARHGFDVTGVDLSKRAIEQAKRLAEQESLPVRFVLSDCLHAREEWRESFDWAFEHTCFCAIDPDRRDDYVRAIRFVLRPGGHLLGIFFNIRAETGPPFGTNRVEVMDRFSPHFDLLLEKVPRSFPNRTGEELLMWWRKRGPAAASRRLPKSSGTTARRPRRRARRE
jgi:SAM-dependent methyltransferase